MKQQLQEILRKGVKPYKSIPFWSWNSYLDEEELVRQIEDMKEAEIGGFIIHARTGLQEEYLGEKWFSCIGVCLNKAKELGMEAWIYDENGWPSGFVGGKLLEVERYRARYLEYVVGAYDESAFAVFVEDERTGYRRVQAPLAGVDTYHCIYLRVSPANTDILNPEVTDQFIVETHEKYYARFSESFGKELAGFFTDEPQYYRWGTPYTPMLEGCFKDVREGLIWLFVEDIRGQEYRYRYYGALNDLYVNNFYKKLYDWCERHSCMLTGHTIEESGLRAQMMGCGAVMPTYEYEHVPAIDWLCRTNGWELSSRQASSVAAQLGKKLVLTETYACTGFDVTPKELRGIGEMQYFNGVNKTCQHLYPYSMAKWGKIDHPTIFGKQSNWQKEFKTFNEYFNRLGCIVGNTEENIDVAIINPVRDVWLDYLYDGNKDRIGVEEEFFNLIAYFRRYGISYHLIDEKILARHGETEGEWLRVGKRRYSALVLPKTQTISSAAYEILQGYRGKLCMLRTPTLVDGRQVSVQLKSNCSLEEIVEDRRVKFFCEEGKAFAVSRSGEIGDFLFIKNMSMTENCKIRMTGIAEEYCALDLETLEVSPIDNRLTLGANDSLILVKDENAKPISYVTKKEDITSNFTVANISENYFVLDMAQIRKETQTFGRKRYVSALFEELLREDYKGNIYVRQTFTLEEKMPLQIIMEKEKLLSVTLNGKQITWRQSAFDINFVCADIGDFVVAGENEFIYSFYFYQHEGVHFALFDPQATESLKNCLYHDTSIETAYLKGDFVVNADMVLCKRSHLPSLTSNFEKEGYPFFKGEVVLKGSFQSCARKQTFLEIDGRYLVAEAKINGVATEITLDYKKDITSLVREGDNEVELVLKSSLRNLFGPHHYISEDSQPYVGPNCFTFRGSWKDGEAKEYDEGYRVLPFGVNTISLLTFEREDEKEL